jgi:hypothetical protein
LVNRPYGTHIRYNAISTGCAALRPWLSARAVTTFTKSLFQGFAD